MRKKYRTKALVLFFWLMIWQIASMLVDNAILLVGPVETFRILLELMGSVELWRSIGFSAVRILGGLLAGTVLGVLFAYGCCRSRFLDALFTPVLKGLRTIPVASFVILLLIWAGNQMLAFWISLLVVLPILFLNLTEGLKSLDLKMSEMAVCFHMPFLKRMRYVYLPQLMPSFLGAFKLALGMCWKSGVAAEVIGQPLHSIGNGMYRAKISLDTGRLFAWTIVLIVVSVLIEKLILFLLKSFVQKSGYIY